LAVSFRGGCLFFFVLRRERERNPHSMYPYTHTYITHITLPCPSYISLPFIHVFSPPNIAFPHTSNVLYVDPRNHVCCCTSADVVSCQLCPRSRER
jgi:hypothetical protein